MPPWIRRKYGMRASETIRRMRELLRKRELELKPIDLNAVISDVLRLLDGETHRRGVKIEKQFVDTLPAVRGDAIHLQQALLNLILNGMEAMSESPESSRRITIRTAYDGKDNVEVAVEDSGPGIPSERLPLLFDSFFTTKPHGMGLGLSIVRRTNLVRKQFQRRSLLPLHTACELEGMNRRDERVRKNRATSFMPIIHVMDNDKSFRVSPVSCGIRECD
jgi:phosphoglycerate-specific signal transduction histidine kinase